MAKSIVFLMPVPFTHHHAKRYGLSLLEDKGIMPHVIDLSYLVHGKVFSQVYEGDPLKKTMVHQVRFFSEFENLVKELSQDAVFVDYLVGLSGIDIKYEKIFRILKKYHARYYVVSDADLPNSFAQQGVSKQSFLLKYSSIFNIRWLGRYIGRIILRVLVKHEIFYSLPLKVFGTDSENMKNYMRKYDNGRMVRVGINSSDHSSYLEYVNNTTEYQRQMEDTCVFLDENAIYSYDYDILKMKKIDSTRYLNAMNRLFQDIEQKTGLEVVIAAHPLSHYEKYPDAFDGRRIIKGKTVELVARSRLVVLHYSTAVSYAVLFNKPLLFVKTDDMVWAKRTNYIDAIAAELGVSAVNIDNKEQLEELTFHLKGFPVERFSKYKYKYLVTREVEDRFTWDIIAEELKKEAPYHPMQIIERET